MIFLYEAIYIAWSINFTRARKRAFYAPFNDIEALDIDVYQIHPIQTRYWNIRTYDHLFYEINGLNGIKPLLLIPLMKLH